MRGSGRNLKETIKRGEKVGVLILKELELYMLINRAIRSDDKKEVC